MQLQEQAFMIDNNDKLQARFMGYEEAIEIMKNYKNVEAVNILASCLKSKRKVVKIAGELSNIILETKNKNNLLPTTTNEA